MNFRQFIINEELAGQSFRFGNMEIVIAPSITKIPLESTPQGPTKSGGPKEAAGVVRNVIQQWFNRIDPKGHQFMASRYVFELSKIEDEWDNLKLTIKFLPKSKKQGTEDILPPGDYRWEFERYKNGKTGRTNYKSPKDAIANIPEDETLAYRGIAWEEWQSINKSGFIASRGHYNLGPEQENLTCFGYHPSTALSYTGSFAPVQYTFSRDKPGVVIAVPRNLLLTHKDDPDGIPQSEMGLKGKLPKEKIVHVWLIVPTQLSNEAYMEFRIPWINATWNKAYGRYDGNLTLGLHQLRTGSGSTAVVYNYAIKQLV